MQALSVPQRRRKTWERAVPTAASRTYSARMHTLSALQAYYYSSWFLLSLINAGLAQGKGRSGLAWWLVSLFIGPIATLLIVVLPGVWTRR
jgi:hypothetical protein